MSETRETTATSNHPFARASFDTLHNRLTVDADLVAQTALRVGAGRSSDITGNDLPVLRDALGRPFIPGASLKGAFRARIEALIATVAPGEVLTFEELEKRTRTEIKKLKEKFRNDEQLSREIWERSTMIDLTFGSPEWAGRLFFKDARVQQDIWFGQFEVRNGVVLNRDTETAEQGLLYDYEVVPAETRFDFSLVLENAEEWQLGLVVLALAPWLRGEAQIGGFRSRGLGYVVLDRDTLKCRYVEIDGIEGVIQLLQEGMEQDGKEEGQPHNTVDITDGQAEPVRQWITAFREKLIEKQGKKPDQQEDNTNAQSNVS